MAARLTRRRFLGSSLAAGSLACGYFVNPVRSAESDSPNERLNLAIIGCANKGWHNVQELKGQNMVALCDVDANYLAKAAETYPQATQHRDYRRMLDKEHKQFDAVVVSTADHHHAVATSIALTLGKHVYCEKPLTHTVQEARKIAQLAADAKVATQMGIQIHAGDNYRRVVEIVRSGVLGRIDEVYCWCNKGWSGGKFAAWEGPPPAHLDWDLWLGPAQERPYSPNIHPGNWRRFWEYGSGTFGDMACHVMDLPFWALELKYPTRVACEGPPVDEVGAPAWVKVQYEFPREGGSPLKFHWSDGGAHFEPVEAARDQHDLPLSRWGLGVLFVGEKGQLAADYGRYLLLPKERFEGFQPPEKSIPASIGHWNEWVAACKGGGETTCNFGYAGALTESVLLGIVAYRSGQAFQWDGPALTAVGAAGAGQYLDKKYRQGWELATRA